ncbi:MAG: HlyD family efflux transporter periplasmic adaptor subunit [Kyrpidia tusciae]|nr:HlyD family efflux transporter periplasmic adaptor subunit [Kyrpidia tusciae]MBE3552643.1 HlyD family efflux transporter periplasmic adaptor subunit [Kyrpidia tusciae]
MRRLVLLNLILWLAVAAAAGAAGFFFWDKAQYIRTNQAQVGADLVVISAPGVGRLTQWSVKTGDRVSAGTVLGTLQPLAVSPMPGTGSGLSPGSAGGAGRTGQGSGGGEGKTAPPALTAVGGGPAATVFAVSPSHPVVSSGSGDVRNGATLQNRFGLRPRVAAVRARSTARPGSSVRPGVRTGVLPAPPRPVSPDTAPRSAPVPTPPPPVNLTSPIDGVLLYTAAAPETIWTPGRTLAVLADLSKPFVNAYIDDNALKNLSVGKDVDVFLDAYPGTSFPGKVVRIADAAGSFAAPELPSAAGTNQTRPTVRVPVRIAVDDFSGKYVVPGMNASVRIHR